MRCGAMTRWGLVARQCRVWQDVLDVSKWWLRARAHAVILFDGLLLHIHDFWPSCPELSARVYIIIGQFIRIGTIIVILRCGRQRGGRVRVAQARSRRWRRRPGSGVRAQHALCDDTQGDSDPAPKQMLHAYRTVASLISSYCLMSVGARRDEIINDSATGNGRPPQTPTECEARSHPQTIGLGVTAVPRCDSLGPSLASALCLILATTML
jgi:hypothetical protein